MTHESRRHACRPFRKDNGQRAWRVYRRCRHIDEWRQVCIWVDDSPPSTPVALAIVRGV